jgi:CBS domain-containing protein
VSATAATALATDVMVCSPKVYGPSLTVGELRAAFADDHVHMLLVVDGSRLVGALVRGDAPESAASVEPALPFATLAGRTVDPTTRADVVRAEMVATGVRRLAVVDDDGTLLGLLCLKRHLDGFCSDADVASRAAGRLGCD